MDEAALKIMVPIAGVAFFVARFQVRAAANKLDIEFQRKATEALFKKRLAVYPPLFSILLTMLKNYRDKQYASEDVKALVSMQKYWEIDNAIYLSPLVTSKLERARKAFAEVMTITNSDNNLCASKTQWRKHIIPEIHCLRVAPKSELGILEAHSFHNPTQVTRLSDVLQEFKKPKPQNQSTAKSAA